MLAGVKGMHFLYVHCNRGAWPSDLGISLARAALMGACLDLSAASVVLLLPEEIIISSTIFDDDVSRDQASSFILPTEQMGYPTTTPQPAHS